MQGRISVSRATCLALLGLGLAAAPVLAADEVWVAAGQPSGGQTFQVAVDPIHSGTLYALTNNGLFKSTDGGADWGFAAAVYGYNMAVDPVDSDNLYIANVDSGIWKSTDAGVTWTNLAGIPKASVVVADPVTEGTLYTIAKHCDIYKSSDGGASWHLIDTGISGLTGNADAVGTQIAVDAANPQILYLSTQVGAYDSSTGMRQGSALSGLYTSADGGAHWTQAVATVGFADVVIDPNDDQNVYAGSYVSNDGGATWTPSTTTPFNFTVIAVAPANSQALWGVTYAGNIGGLWSSSDQGAHWSQVSSMPDGNASFGSAVYNLAYDPGTPADVYAASMAFGVFKSSDGGATWADSSAGLAGVLPLQIFADVTGDIYMGTQGSGIFKSSDGGVTWAPKDDGIAVNIGSAGITAHSLVEAATPGTLYETDQGSLYKTSDGGDNWTALTVTGSTGSTNALAVDPEQAQTVYVGDGGGQVLKSVDGGSTWTASTSGLSGDGIWALTVAPTNSKVLFAGGFSSGLYKSSDGGQTWAESDSGMPVAFGIWCVAVDPTDAEIVYACPGNAGIYKSTDGGATWAKAGDIGDGTLRVLQIDPNDPDVIYTSNYGAGVLVSTDGGDTWTMLDDPSTSSAATRGTESVTGAGASHRTVSVSSSQSATLASIAVDPRHAGQLYGAVSTGQVYTLGLREVTATTGVTQKGASGGSSSGGGGGGFPLLGLLFLGAAALRRRQ